MGMTEREKHLEVLEKLHDSMRIYNSIMLSTERIEALAFAISSIRTDLKHDLMHHREELALRACQYAVMVMIVQGKGFSYDDEAVNWGEVLEWLNKELAHASKLKQN